MKRDNCYWYSSLSFLLGTIICYIALQFKYFDIDLEINLVNTLISITTLAVGAFIAITIQKRFNHGQNNYAFIKDKFENLWIAFNSFSDNLNSSENIPLSTMTAFTKNAYSQINFLKIIYNSFGVNDKLIVKLENSVDEFEYILNLPIKDNIINLKNIREDISSNISEIQKCFGEILGQISNL